MKTRHAVFNGQRVEAEVGDYKGLVGMTERNGVTSIAFKAEPRKAAKADAEITIAGEPWIVLDSRPADSSRGLVVLDVQPKEAAA